ncbi:MAG TPA: HU family DNA-binding protein [Acidimicrobiales bacterium]
MEVIVNKSQLVRAVSDSTSLSRRTVEDVVDVLFDSVVTAVQSGRKVTIIGFGTFNPIDRAPRLGRNPRTGAAVPIPASKGVRFATSSAFKNALNSKEGAPMAVKKAAKKAVRKAPARKRTAAKKSTAKKAVRKAPARKRPAKKSAAKKATRKAPARKRPAKKSAAKKATRKAPARKRPAARKTAKKAVRKAPARKRPAKRARKTARR